MPKFVMFALRFFKPEVTETQKLNEEIDEEIGERTYRKENDRQQEDFRNYRLMRYPINKLKQIAVYDELSSKFYQGKEKEKTGA